MKKKSRYLETAAILFVFVSLAYFLWPGDDAVVSEPEWSCIKSGIQWECTVSFDVTNKSNIHQFRKASIRGLVVSGGKYGKLSIRGEKLFEIEVPPRAAKKITQTSISPARHRAGDKAIQGACSIYSRPEPLSMPPQLG